MGDSLALAAALAIVAAYFYTLGKSAGKKTPKPDPLPAIPPVVCAEWSWRVVLDCEGNPATVSLELSPEAENWFAHPEWTML